MVLCPSGDVVGPALCRSRSCRNASSHVVHSPAGARVIRKRTATATTSVLHVGAPRASDLASGPLAALLADAGSGCRRTRLVLALLGQEGLDGGADLVRGGQLDRLGQQRGLGLRVGAAQEGVELLLERAGGGRHLRGGRPLAGARGGRR